MLEVNLKHFYTEQDLRLIYEMSCTYFQQIEGYSSESVKLLFFDTQISKVPSVAILSLWKLNVENIVHSQPFV